MTRAYLPNRRPGTTHSLIWDPHQTGKGIHFKITVGRYADGKIGEIFVAAGGRHITSPQADIARDVGALASLALQYGVPLSVLQKAVLRGEDSLPHTMIGAILDSVEEWER